MIRVGRVIALALLSNVQKASQTLRAAKSRDAVVKLGVASSAACACDSSALAFKIAMTACCRSSLLLMAR